MVEVDCVCVWDEDGNNTECSGGIVMVMQMVWAECCLGLDIQEVISWELVNGGNWVLWWNTGEWIYARWCMSSELQVVLLGCADIEVLECKSEIVCYVGIEDSHILSYRDLGWDGGCLCVKIEVEVNIMVG